MLLNQSFKGLNDLWRYLLGIFVVFLFYGIGQLPLYGVIYLQMSRNIGLGSEELINFENTMNFESLGINKNLGFLLLILMFAIALAGLYMVVKYLHFKKMKDYVTVKTDIDYSKIVFGFVLWAGLNILIEGINYIISPGNYSFNLELEGFLPLVVISLVFLPIQTSFEEFFFRGYILQGIAFFAKNKWVPLLMSSIFFGLVHGTNPEVAQYGFWTMQIYYVIAGLFLAFITIWDDSLELALGVHAATNILGATLFTYRGSVLQTDSLFMINEVKPLWMIAGFIVSAVVFIAICRSKYQWKKIAYCMEDIIQKDDSESIADIGK